MKATNSTKATNSIHSPTTKSNLLYIFARRNENSCKKVTKAELNKVTKANLTKANLSKVNLLSIDSNPTNYKNNSETMKKKNQNSSAEKCTRESLYVFE